MKAVDELENSIDCLVNNKWVRLNKALVDGELDRFNDLLPGIKGWFDEFCELLPLAGFKREAELRLCLQSMIKEMTYFINIIGHELIIELASNPPGDVESENCR